MKSYDCFLLQYSIQESLLVWLQPMVPDLKLKVSNPGFQKIAMVLMKEYLSMMAFGFVIPIQ
eukprot:04252.XXX_201475_201660_1 [CDS] Oithona nana genome sequencing.